MSGLQDSNGEEEGKSKNSTINEEGKELVWCPKDQELGIGNGATKRDDDGELTQIGQRGCTTIDYMVRDEAGRARPLEMVIGIWSKE